MVCAEKGYPFVCVMAESFSVERRKLMRFLGAKVVLTPAHLKGSGMVEKSKELSAAHGWFLADQFKNDANAWIHEITTGPEIVEAFRGSPGGLNYFITGYGTGGTVKGVGKVIKDKMPETKIILAEPDNAPLIYSGVPQSYKADGSIAEPHPMWRPHLLQGWTTDFIPKLTSDALAAGYVHEVMPTSGFDAIQCSKDLAQKEGIFTGISGGGTFSLALQARTVLNPPFMLSIVFAIIRISYIHNTRSM